MAKGRYRAWVRARKLGLMGALIIPRERWKDPAAKRVVARDKILLTEVALAQQDMHQSAAQGHDAGWREAIRGHTRPAEGPSGRGDVRVVCVEGRGGCSLPCWRNTG